MSRYWGEEREDGAVYAVHLKKICYGVPDSYQNSKVIDVSKLKKDDDAIAHLQWETVKERSIKAGSLKKLTDCLLGPEGELDTRHFNVFFATYRAFSTQEEVLKLLFERYKLSLHESLNGLTSIINGLRSVFVCWIDLYPDDFCDAPKHSALHLVLDFARRNLPHLQDVVLRAANLLRKFCVDEVRGTTKRACLQRLCLLNQADEFSFGELSLRGLRDIQHEDPYYIAEQLTYYDAELFKRVMTHQCLGCFWSKRHKVSPEEVFSVRSTIDQFNAVSQRVSSSILQPGLRPPIRAKLIEKWIDILRELRGLKNYSSLKSVLSALRSEPVYCLKSIWSSVPRNKLDDFEEQSRLFSEDNNSSASREILEREGTAKSVLTAPKGDLRARQMGTVPYLGTFLTDLTFIDSAFPDKLEGGLINFDKRRKEFEIIAQIKLFQASAQSYSIQPDPRFRIWFARLPVLSEDERYTVSLSLQSHSASTPVPLRKRRSWFDPFSSMFSPDGFDGSSNGNSVLGRSHFYDFNQNSTMPVLQKRSQRSSSTPGLYQFAAQEFDKQGFLGSSTSSELSSGRTGLGRAGSESLRMFDNTSFRSRVSIPNCTQGPVLSCRLLRKGVLCPPAHTRSSSSSRVTEKAFRCQRWDDNINMMPALPWQYHPMPYYFGDRPMHSSNTSMVDLSRPFKVNPGLNGIALHDAYIDNPVPLDGNFNNKLSSRSSSYQSVITAVNVAASKPSTTHVTNDTRDSHIIRIVLDGSVQCDENKTMLYKCLRVTYTDKTVAVIERAIEKLNLQGSPSDFALIQQLPDGGELLLPEKSNLYYAANRNADMSFVLKTKDVALNTGTKSKKKYNNLLRWNSGFL